MNIKRIAFFIICAIGLIVAAFLIIYTVLFAAPKKGAATESFVVPLKFDMSQIAERLHDQGFIKSEGGFDFALRGKGGPSKISSGGYLISKSMNAIEIAGILSSKPDMQWIVIPEGLRKEEIGELMVKNIGWSAAELADWNTKATNTDPSYFEGVYFPDTYLISNGSTPQDVAKKLIAHFNEKFAPYAKQAAAANIKWTTALTLASIVQREAAGANDMPLIAGILWNRLLKGMKIQIDATVQYARGNTGAGWWAPITHADESIDSPYNTYLNKGLPPHPISNPGTEAINATINSTDTECLYYIHDKDGVIHCSKTYDEQLANIKQYLQ